MGEVQLNDLLKGFLNKSVRVKFAGNQKTTGILQSYGQMGMLLTHGEGVQFVPFNQVLSISEITPGSTRGFAVK